VPAQLEAIKYSKEITEARNSLYRVQSLRGGIVKIDESLPDQLILVFRMDQVVLPPDLQSEIAGRSIWIFLLDEHVEIAQKPGRESVHCVNHDCILVAIDGVRVTQFHRLAVQVAVCIYAQRTVC